MELSHGQKTGGWDPHPRPSGSRAHLRLKVRDVLVGTQKEARG